MVYWAFLHQEFKVYSPFQRGAIAEWLEQLGYGAENCQNMVSLRLGFIIRWLVNSLCPPSCKLVPFSKYGRVRQWKEKNGHRLLSAVPETHWNSNPSLPFWLLGYGKPLPFTSILSKHLSFSKNFNMNNKMMRILAPTIDFYWAFVTPTV